MYYNTTEVNSSLNVYPTAYLTNSSSTPSFSSIVELNFSAIPIVFTFSTLVHIYLSSPSKLAFYYSPALEIVSCIKPVASGNFLYSYFICKRSIKKS